MTAVTRLFVATLPGVLLLIATMGWHPGMTWDSIAYCDAATSLARGDGPVVRLPDDPTAQFDAGNNLIERHPLLLWPPGYPLVLAGVMRVVHLDAAPAAALLNVLSLTALLCCVWVILRAAVDVNAATAATAVAGVTPAVQWLYRMALSDGLFLLVCAALVLIFVHGRRTQLRHPLEDWIAPIAIGAAIHVRFTGVFLVVWHAVVAAGRAPRRLGVAKVVSVAAGLVLGSAFLWHRAWTFGCVFCEPRHPSLRGPLQNLADLATSTLRSMPIVTEWRAGPWDAVGSIVGVAVMTWFLPRRRLVPPAPAIATVVGIVGALAAIYAVGLIAMRSVVHFENLNPRLVAPVALPLSCALLAWWLRRFTVRGAAVAATSLAGLLIAGQVAGVASRPWRELTQPDPRQTPFLTFVAAAVRDQPQTTVFTNDAVTIAAQIGFGRRAFWLPPAGAPALPAGGSALAVFYLRGDSGEAVRIAALDRIGTRLPSDRSFVAWRLTSSPPPSSAAAPGASRR